MTGHSFAVASVGLADPPSGEGALPVRSVAWGWRELRTRQTIAFNDWPGDVNVRQDV